MIPYMYADLRALLKNLLQIIMKHKEIEKWKTGPQLKALELFFLTSKICRWDLEFKKSKKIEK